MRTISFITVWDQEHRSPVSQIYLNDALIAKAIPMAPKNHSTPDSGQKYQVGYRDLLSSKLSEDEYKLDPSEVNAIVDYLVTTEFFKEFYPY